MSFKQEIASWDGKSASDIGAIYSRYSDDDTFVPKLIEFSLQTDLQKGATWLLKRYLENNRKLTASEIAALFKRLPELEQWEAKLHMLQCIPYMPIQESEKKNVEAFLRRCLVENNKLVRTWAYNGFYEISRQYPEYKEETKKFFEMAMKDEAPSVKARIRNIMRAGFVNDK